MRKLPKTHKIIGIVGPSGAGKTTLADGLGKVLQATVYQEKPQDNPFFQKFYSDLHEKVKPSDAAFHSEIFFLQAAFDQAMDAREKLKDGLVIWDVPIQGHMMYAELLRQQGFLSQLCFDEYKNKYEECLQQILRPDVLLVATVASTQKEHVNAIVKHIEERGRPEEMEVPIEYWQSQVGYWEDQMGQAQSIPHVTLDAGLIDWRTESGLFQVLEIIDEHLLFKAN